MSEFNLTEALERYRDMSAELAPAIAALDALKKDIQRHVTETGEVAQVDGASVTIRNGYTRANWDGRALDGYAAAHPEILAFRRETEVGPSAVVKVTP